MRKALEVVKKFAKDEEGAALIEYTVLLGVLIVAVVTSIGLVGGWVQTKWAGFCGALTGVVNGGTC